ncbi:hypothetical protein HMPREF0492_1450 [Lactobacillus acidophilus ATCC 4796]|uniref:Uncharacterized protein n=1 Tax=Lactobacillus acidophilus (strain ATCC 700396 / NCK56 / N2 / NCFM) TaxID=272621 RepID=Q5FK59_LACAC|nr:hypothetical protein LBA1069 [Lactobacillus acidophilus NCFM]ASN46948.1 hypothetical protein CGZ81_07055 [Lactobacillus acidophilus]EEJ75798.1 hypothetical protein HMPREF0492_1450 [Lactobacillus acidophilus ATCC 4796]CDF67855.1 Putative uncharacterized protein [Lactobacillus acidophilus DSM 20079 = JCM 1132 = NBRC 13951 = CIP 76.13]CDF69528.1 Putative uncharacterized protein [Lactobacillus acidophilus CIRM-BIA 442]CDF71324.1 Putative uncharacterized protein [Lactobacillus acidophilus CIRM-B
MATKQFIILKVLNYWIYSIDVDAAGLMQEKSYESK